MLVAPSSFHGIHGLAVDAQGRLLAGTVVGNDMWEVDRQTGQARVFIPAPLGEADDIAVGPRGELAWTSYTQGILRYREHDMAAIHDLAKGLPGINSVAFDRTRGKLYASQVFYGDALWEIDVSGNKPPRAIAKEIGGFNGFEVGPDGMLYGPLWFKGQVVRIDPANGAIRVLNAQFKTPAAANLDGKGNLWVIDTHTGELCKVALATGEKTVVKQLATSLDNLAIAPEGTIYVSNMSDNSIEAYEPSTGALRTLTRGKLAAPGGMKLDGDQLFIADVFSLRAIDVNTGAVRDVLRAHASELKYPSAVGLGAKTMALSSSATGTVELVDRATQRELEVVPGFKAPVDAIPLDDQTLLVAEVATGNILRATGEHYRERAVLASGLEGPTQMILGRDGSLYVTESAGRLTRVDLTTGEKQPVADALTIPEGLAETPWGTFVIAESKLGRLVEIDPGSGRRSIIAEDLPIGFSPERPDLTPAYLATGVAVGPEGTIYVSADRDNSLLRLRPRR